MILEESIEERAFRIIFGSHENNLNLSKNMIIPVIPYDGEEANRVMNIAYPSEDRPAKVYNNFEGEKIVELGFSADAEEREPNILRQYSKGRRDDGRTMIEEKQDDAIDDYLGDREQIITLDDMLRFDRMRLGIEMMHVLEREDCQEEIHEGDSPLDSEDLEDKCPERNASIAHEKCTTDEYNDEDVLLPLPGQLITPTHDFAYECDSKIDFERQDSMDSSVSSAFTTASSVISSSPSIMKLKARKRVLERYLSDNSLKNFKFGSVTAAA
eukprot:218786_1